MKTLTSVVFLAIAIATASTAQAMPGDCRTKSLHGLWDCR